MHHEADKNSMNSCQLINNNNNNIIIMPHSCSCGKKVDALFHMQKRL